MARGDAAVLLDIDGHTTPCRSALIRADQAHALSCADALTLLVEPECHAGHALCALLPGAPAAMDLSALEPCPQDARALLTALVPTACRARHVDERVVRVLAWLDAMAAAARFDEVDLAGALRLAHLSESRFMHVFKEATGIPWRRAVLWRRLQVALEHAATGTTLTTAAHAAGYADAAHLSRQCVQLLGLPPSVVMHVGRFIQGEPGAH